MSKVLVMIGFCIYFDFVCGDGVEVLVDVVNVVSCYEIYIWEVVWFIVGGYIGNGIVEVVIELCCSDLYCGCWG